MNIIALLQIIISLIVIGLILMQERGSDAGGLFGAGGGGADGLYQKRRGFERILFYSTIVLVILFALLAAANLFIQ
ncbi:MAG: preprotein translocase subunit SecG [Candidatus Harrisonbacteria bacterium]|nr:preprotein translocase subunit SecG [Candidatus Harrisonbacteria bacterium]